VVRPCLGLEEIGGDEVEEEIEGGDEEVAYLP
jgi:hypothetical protein